MPRLILALKNLPTRGKVVFMVLVDVVLLFLMLMLAYVLRISAFELPLPRLLPSYVFAPVLSVACAYAAGVYQAAGRNYSNRVEHVIFLSQGLALLMWALLLLVFGTEGFARSVLFIYGVLACIAMIAVRRTAASIFAIEGVGKRRKAKIPVLIYGAGPTGASLVEQMRKAGDRQPVAFVDTDYTLVDRQIAGLNVYTTEHLPDVIDRYEPKEVIVAKSGLTRANRQALIDTFLEYQLQVNITPSVDEIVSGKVGINDIRPVLLEDLLGRDPVPPDRELMESAIKNQVVLVTGAGGSIGSELVRQALLYQPKKLILLDHSEFALFEIHREVESRNLRENSSTILIPVLCDVQDKARVSSIMAEHNVDIVFHAAAYKHVRMVQENAAAGVNNNIFGTRACAEAALENQVKRFILISTDKAVRSTSVMGASKRVAEMIIQALAAEPGHTTIFSMVRFGNVLGSTGSVVPLFREQIAKGGPITVTHPDVTRYFMLIPEAAQLVIQAGAMAEGGEVFVLDMGESVKIMQLAETMIELAGLTAKTQANPEGDIEIVVTGLKDGEKLYEELQIGNDISTTSHPRIMKSKEIMLPFKQLKKAMAGLSQHDRTFVPGAVLFKELDAIAAGKKQ